MTMQPKVSIIIPVYNVEKYLAECLDSVVNQTLPDIQIICVNDGSTDGSLAILQEYAARDSRIEVIDKPNEGNPGAARNAGIPRVRGKYMYFLDSDDWIDSTLCEKAYYRLESTGADVVFFFFHEIAEHGQKNRCLSFTSNYCKWATTSIANEDLFGFACAPWTRVIRTTFFHKLDTQFPEAFLPEDFYLHWALIANEPQSEILLEKLYYYRLREGSITGEKGEYLAKATWAYSLIKEYFKRIGKYEKYRSRFLNNKFGTFFYLYQDMIKRVRPYHVRWFRESLDEEEMDFLRNSKTIDPDMRDTIMALLDGALEQENVCGTLVQKNAKPALYRRLKLRWKVFNDRFLRKAIRPIEEIIRVCRGKSQQKEQKSICQNGQQSVVDVWELRIKELSEQLAMRDKEIVEIKASCEEYIRFPKKKKNVA